MKLCALCDAMLPCLVSVVILPCYPHHHASREARLQPASMLPGCARPPHHAIYTPIPCWGRQLDINGYSHRQTLCQAWQGIYLHKNRSQYSNLTNRQSYLTVQICYCDTRVQWYTERMSEYKLYLGDCLEFMRTMPDKGIDVVITSPPYNMRTRIRNGEYTGRESSGDFSNKYSDFSDDMPIDKYYKFHGLVIENILRISSLVFINIQIVTGSKEAWFRLIGDFSKRIRDVIVWDKGEGQPAMHPSVINRASELILVLESDAVAGRAFNKSYFERGAMPDIWRVARDGNSVEGHGAVFPI